jgi:hypothetical protein
MHMHLRLTQNLVISGLPTFTIIIVVGSSFCKADIIVFRDIELVIKVFYMADPFSLSMLSSISGRRHFL